jgi:ABC-2 type transport system permease protein
MSAFTYHLTFEFRGGVRNRTLLLLNYLFPLGFYLLASAMMVNLNPGLKDTLIPAMVAFAVLSSVLLGLPDPIVTAREAGIFRSYKIHGIPEFSILVIPALTTLIHLCITSLIIVVTAPILFGAVLPANWLGFILSFVLLTLSCTAIALLIGVIAPNSRATVLISQAIFLPSMLIGGLMFPTQMLPEALRQLSLLLPTTHAMNIYNVFARGLPYDLNPYLSVAVLYFGAAVAFGLAIYLFNWDSQNKTQRGRPVLAALALVPFALAVVASLLGFAAPV